MAEILILCQSPQTKTRVMYRTNLSFLGVQKYLSNMVSLGLLEVHHSRPRYVTSLKGFDFLNKWRALTGLLAKDGGVQKLTGQVVLIDSSPFSPHEATARPSACARTPVC